MFKRIQNLYKKIKTLVESVRMFVCKNCLVPTFFLGLRIYLFYSILKL